MNILFLLEEEGVPKTWSTGLEKKTALKWMLFQELYSVVISAGDV